jgi:uncharacterized protein involved in exopolysaccharide biosynthesis
MPDLFDLLARWWKQVLAVMLLALLTVGIIVFLKPSQYLSMSTAVPGSTYAADRSKIFNENIQILYSNLGTTDDLDMIVGTGQLDTVYEAVSAAFNLEDHYKMSEKGEPAKRKAVYLLKKNSKVSKSEFGEIKVKTWDTDKNLAPQLANAIMDKLQEIHQDLQSSGNEKVLAGLVSGKKKIQSEIDSISNFLRNSNITTENASGYSSRRNFLSGQLQEYDKLIGQYEVMIQTRPLVLIIVEKAKPAAWPSRPKRIQALIITAVLSFVFAVFLALVLERRKIPVDRIYS